VLVEGTLGEIRMQLVRLYSGKDGQSHFEDIDIVLEPVHIAHFSKAVAVENLKFGKIGDMNEITWHTQDEPAYIVILNGAMELEVGDGTKKVINAGDILLAEDTTGQGHITRSIKGKGWSFLIAPVKKVNN
jgi:hypothetical protein